MISIDLNKTAFCVSYYGKHCIFLWIVQLIEFVTCVSVCLWNSEWLFLDINLFPRHVLNTHESFSIFCMKNGGVYILFLSKPFVRNSDIRIRISHIPKYLNSRTISILWKFLLTIYGCKNTCILNMDNKYYFKSY